VQAIRFYLAMQQIDHDFNRDMKRAADNFRKADEAFKKIPFPKKIDRATLAETRADKSKDEPARSRFEPGSHIRHDRDSHIRKS
jgi:hypothetical protein